MQFTAGTGALVAEVLPTQLGKLAVQYVDDSAMIFESSSAPDAVAGVPFVKNCFAVVTQTKRQRLDTAIRELSRAEVEHRPPGLSPSSGRFRVMCHVDGSLVSIPLDARSTLERVISSNTNSRVELRGSCDEYWVVGRQELRHLLLCARLPRPAKPPKTKGAVSYELSAMLIAASQPTPEDVFLDPFAGSGSFVSARLERPAQQVWYCDRDLHRHRRDLPQHLTTNKRVRLLAEDALSLPSIPSGSVDVIVTDPPWAEHEDVGQPYPEFACEIGISISRVLRPESGRFVLLISRSNAAVMRSGLESAGLAVGQEHGILVNGHPATVLIGGV